MYVRQRPGKDRRVADGVMLGREGQYRAIATPDRKVVELMIIASFTWGAFRISERAAQAAERSPCSRARTTAGVEARVVPLYT